MIYVVFLLDLICAFGNNFSLSSIFGAAVSEQNCTSGTIEVIEVVPVYLWFPKP